MAEAAADRNLLFGIMALQMDFITRDHLVEALHAWALEKSKPLGQILVDRGWLEPGLRNILEPLVDAHVGRHGGEPERSLAALGTTRDSLGPITEVDDPEVRSSLSRVDSYATMVRVVDEAGESAASAIPSVGMPTGSGLRFLVLRPHARGGIGVVSVALDRELNREVALKEIQDRHADEPASRARFLMEAEVTGGLEHPGIVPVYGLGLHPDGRPYYAMRFIRGDSFKEAIERFHRGDWDGSETRPLALRKLLRRFLDVCDAIAYAHSRGIIHRDLKPGNIMLGEYGETLVVDWGLAKALGQPEPSHLPGERPLVPSQASGSAETLPGSTIGTPAFMSPEQAAGELDRLGPTSDVYSLGATLYNLLAGRPPLSGSDIAEILERVRAGDFPPAIQVDRNLARALDAICRKAMALKPEDRYVSPRALADDLEHWLADERVAAYREPISDRLARWGRRHRALVISATAMMLTASTAASLIYKERLERQSAELRRSASEREAEQARQVAQLREYHELLGRAREARRSARPGWTWAAGDDLARAARLDSASRDPVELRTEAAAGLGEVDLRRRAALPGEMVAHCLAFSPDGRHLALAQSKAQAFTVCSVKVFDLATQQVTRTLTFGPPLRWLTSRAVQDGARSVAFGPGGRLAVGARSGRVHLWDLSGAAPAPVSWDAHLQEVTSLAFSPDGQVLYTGSIDGTLLRWDVAKPGAAAPRRTHAFRSPVPVAGLTLDAGGRALFASTAGPIQGLNPADLTPKGPPIANGVGKAALSPDGRTLAVDRGGQVELISPESGLVMSTFRDTRLGEASGAPLSKLAFSPDGSLLVTACSADVEHAVKLWEVVSGRLVSTVHVAGTDNLEAAFAPDGRTLATIGDRGAWLFEVGGPDIQESAAFHPRPLLAVDLAPDGRSLAGLSGTEARGEGPSGVEVRLWDLEDRSRPVREAAIPDPSAPGLAFDPRGRWLAFRRAGLEFWGLRGGPDPKPLAIDAATAFSLSADGSRAWGLSRDEVISWDLADGAPKTRWSNRASEILTGLSGLTCVWAGRDRVLAGGRDGLVRRLRSLDGQQDATWNPAAGPIRSLALSPDEATAAVGTQTGGLSLYRVATGERLASWEVHSEAVQSVAFADDGRLLASGSVDRTVRLWWLGAGQWHELMTLRMTSGPVRTVRFGPGGKTLVIAVDGERAVRIWHLDRLRERLSPLGLDWSAGDSRPTEATPDHKDR